MLIGAIKIRLRTDLIGALLFSIYSSIYPSGDLIRGSLI